MTVGSPWLFLTEEEILTLGLCSHLHMELVGDAPLYDGCDNGPENDGSEHSTTSHCDEAVISRSSVQSRFSNDSHAEHGSREAKSYFWYPDLGGICGAQGQGSLPFEFHPGALMTMIWFRRLLYPHNR